MTQVQQIEFPAGFFTQTIADKFQQFHADNPHVLQALILRSLMLKGRGQTKIGIKMLFEVLRWDYIIHTVTDEPFRLNNNYTAYYARLIEKECPELAGFFTKRRSQSDG